MGVKEGQPRRIPLAMAADYARLIAQLRSFYDFTEKAVLLVGAGGGQLRKSPQRRPLPVP